MIERLFYDFNEDHNLILDTPQVVFDSAMAVTKLEQVLTNPAKLVHMEQGKGVRLIFDQKRMKKLQDEPTNGVENGASHWLYALTAIKSETPSDLGDPVMNVDMSLGTLVDGQRRGMSAELVWPLEDDAIASRVATDAMRRIALTFGYLKKNIVDSAYAHMDDQRGADFQALDMACSCLATEGGEHGHNRGRAGLYGHNLYNRQLVLTCLHGVVAAVRTHN